jgi:ABC-2 type transport system ATP-binding protein
VSEPAVRVAELRKSFDVPEREAGLWAATKSLVRRKARKVKAVDGISARWFWRFGLKRYSGASA